MALVVPIVHNNGTSRDALIEQRCEFGRALIAANQALATMAPNGRDYYPVDGLFQQAMAQHHRRQLVLKALADEIVEETEILAGLREEEPREAR